MKTKQRITLVETRRGCQMMEKESRYDVMFDGVLFFQLYWNLRGYVGYLPATPEVKGNKPASLDIGEKAISAYKKEIGKLNKEWATFES